MTWDGLAEGKGGEEWENYIVISNFKKKQQKALTALARAWFLFQVYTWCLTAISGYSLAAVSRLARGANIYMQTSTNAHKIKRDKSLKRKIWARELPPRLRILIARPEELGSISRTHIMAY